MYKFLVAIASLLIFPINVHAIEVKNYYSLHNLESLFVENGTVQNLSVYGHQNAIKIYDNKLGTWGINPGIVISTGNAFHYYSGPNQSPGNTTVFGTAGSTLISTAVNAPSYDAAGFSFDFVASSDSVSFNFVFGSEEYPEFKNSIFNDMFGVWLTGADGRKRQIAHDKLGNLINVNSAFMEYSTGTELDGWTGILKTTAKVTPGGKYNIEFVIADVSDYEYDSTAFISNFTGSGKYKEPEKTYAFLFGPDYGYNGSKRDADGFYHVNTISKLIDDAFPHVETIKISTQGEGLSIYDFENAFKKYAIEPDDKILIYYVGHGYTDTLQNENTLTKENERLRLDTYYDHHKIISDDQMNRLIYDYFRHNSVTMIIDACYSGGFWGTTTPPPGESGDLAILGNVTLLASAREDATAFFSSKNGMTLFSFALENALTKTGEFINADTRQTGVVTIDMIADYINNFIINKKYLQHIDLIGEEVSFLDFNSDINYFSIYDLDTYSMEAALFLSEKDAHKLIYYPHFDSFTQKISETPEPSSIILILFGSAYILKLRLKI